MILRRLSFFLFCLSLQPLWAAIDASLMTIQQVLENRVSQVVRLYDPKAVTLVHLEPKKDKSPLPYTPFLLERLEFETEGMVSLDRIEITIFSDTLQSSGPLKDLLLPLTKHYGPDPTIQVRPFPEHSAILSPLKREISSLGMPSITREMQIGLGIGVCLFLLLGFMAWSQGKHRNRLLQAIDVAARTVGTSLKPTTPSHARSTEVSAETSRTGRTPLSLPDKGVLALFADCYWAQEDGYAHHLWKRMNLGKRSAVLAKMPFLESYVEYITQFESKDLGYDLIPYYLDPYPLAQLDNQGLGDLVRKTPALLNRLPPLRKNALALTAMERIELEQKAQTLAAPASTMPEPNPSKPRVLKRSGTIPLSNVQEESEVMSFQFLSLDLKEQIPSLAWLLELPVETVEEELKQYSAADLAAAWIGPDKVLAELSKRLPPKKFLLIQSFLQQLKPSRSADAFQRLHRFSIEKLKTDPRGENATPVQNVA